MGKAGGRLTAKRRTKKTAAFGHVVPLGGTCLVTKHLANKGLRICKFPFDWMYSTPYLVRHALLDDFKTFLDATKCQRSDAQAEEKCGTVHTTYRRMQSSKGKNIVFPHHHLWPGASNARRDRGSYRRSVARLRSVLRSPAKKMFVAALSAARDSDVEALRDRDWRPKGPGKCPVPVEGGPELCSQAEVLRLFDCLKRKASGPLHLEVVYLLQSEKRMRPHSKVVLQKREKEMSLRVSELSCKGTNTGLVFREDADMLAFHQLITDCGRRHFKLRSLDEDGTKGTKGYRDEVSKRSQRAGRQRRVRFLQANPKRQGSEAYQRYEAYKKARTVGEFLELGGVPGDLTFDQSRGFLTFL